MHARAAVFSFITVVASVALLAPSALVTAAHAAPVTGRIVDQNGDPVPGASIRLGPMRPNTVPRSGDIVTTADEEGRFEVNSPARPNQVLYIGFGQTGFINLAGILDPARGLSVGDLAIEKLPPIDNPDYQWVKPYWPVQDNTDLGCNFCHGQQRKDWFETEMAKSAVNPRVHSLYLGTDLDGNPAGDGWRKENPNEAGPCANCHAPAAAINAPGETVLTEVEGVAREGIFCDVCHKVRDVIVDNGPGVGGSLRYQRPSAWISNGLFVFGPFEDIGGGPMVTSYNPLFKTSRFCAACHEWTNDYGVKVLSTYSEWSEMSGADPDALQCQDCHMKKKFGADYHGEADDTAYILDNAHFQSMAGVLRPVSRIFPHKFYSGREHVLEAAGMKVEAARNEAGELVVKVVVENVNAGHALPTGMAFRHMILVVEASVDGESMAQTGGPTVPDYGGEGDADEDFAGRPGKGYARVLGDGTGARNVPFWRATEVIEDTRIPVLESDAVELRFVGPPSGDGAHVRARLIYRRTFREMNLTKKWGEADVELAAKELDVPFPVHDPVHDAAPVEAPEDAGAQPPAADGGVVRAGGDENPAGGCGCRIGAAGGPETLGLLLGLLGFAIGRRRRF